MPRYLIGVITKGFSVRESVGTKRSLVGTFKIKCIKGRNGNKVQKGHKGRSD